MRNTTLPNSARKKAPASKRVATPARPSASAPLSTRRYVRRVATYAGDRSDPRKFRDAMMPDDAVRFHLDLLLDENRAVPMRCFGVLIEEHDKYPVVLEPPSHDGLAAIDMGSLNDEPPFKTNLFGKKLAVDEFFTVTGGPSGAGTFRIIELR